MKNKINEIKIEKKNYAFCNWLENKILISDDLNKILGYDFVIK